MLSLNITHLILYVRISSLQEEKLRNIPFLMFTSIIESILTILWCMKATVSTLCHKNMYKKYIYDDVAIYKTINTSMSIFTIIFIIISTHHHHSNTIILVIILIIWFLQWFLKDILDVWYYDYDLYINMAYMNMTFDKQQHHKHHHHFHTIYMINIFSTIFNHHNHHHHHHKIIIFKSAPSSLSSLSSSSSRYINHHQNH